MRCTFPRTVGFKADGIHIAWSQRDASKEYPFFQLPCGKCLECRLEYARTWAIRCVHEASCHEENSFITLTYSDDNLKSSKLVYSDFQKFMKRLRRSLNHPVGVFVTGEYGEKNKRPHWHALIFGWRPADAVPKGRNERGDQIWTSKHLDSLWGLGFTDFGTVTFESAGYCARYAAKKLVHGMDGSHEFEPISKRSSKHAIGKAWLEKNFLFVAQNGFVNVRKGDRSVQSAPVPRYYEKWLLKHKPELWLGYVTKKLAKQKEASQRSRYESAVWWWNDRQRVRRGETSRQLSILETRALITKSKFKQLQDHLKL